LIVLEKEQQIASHQSGHNSGVIHTGIYYKPGSVKAKASAAGHDAIIAYSQQHGIPFDLCGKVIVALDESELSRLNDLYQRGIANGVKDLELIDPPRLHEIEPNAAGIKAIYSPHTGIIDYRKVAAQYAEDVRTCGGEIVTGTTVTRIETRQDKSILITDHNEIQANFVVTCAGLYSDKISQENGKKNPMRIVPFRGDYYMLTPEKRSLVHGLIYPVPDPQFPFLGVHYTRIHNGEVWVGPNAVLAFAREGYGRWNINLPELLDTLTFPGFWKMAARYWKQGAKEMYADYVKSAYVALAQRYLPVITGADFLPGPSGVRAQALDAAGNLVDDFVIKRGSHVAHVQNAPSPGATSSLIIAKMIVDELNIA
jgi:L-2-hydroxyglutarate oxidase LhgO